MEIATRIGTVRIRTAGRDTPALRRAVSARLGGADPRPAGLPPAAILVVRHLSDPLPGRIGTRAGSVHSDPLWERALRERLADLARRATHPDRGWIAPGSEAILFTDEAEMLACLALDLARGEHQRRWWWRTILRALHVPGLAPLLLEQARSAPAAFAHLDRWGEAVRVARVLDAAETARVLKAMVRVHELSPELLVSEAVAPSPSHERGATMEIPLGEAATSTEGASPEVAPPLSPGLAPWHRWLPAVQAAVLSREQEHLLGVVLGVHLAPAQVRSRWFALEVRQWWSPHSFDPPLLPSYSPAPGVREAPSRTVDGQQRFSPGRIEQDRREGEVSPRDPARVTEPPLPLPLERNEIASDPWDGRRRPPNAMKGRGDGMWEEVGESEAPTLPMETHCEEDARHDEPHPAPLPDEGLPTHLGGVLYLINLIEHLDLLHGSEVQERAWGLLELLARALLGPLAQDHEHDSLWPQLAELDGRAPADRLDPALSPWLMSLLPAIHRRLEEALGVDPDEVAETLLLCPGRIYVTSSHVDLVADLGRISLPVRRAGLDRDPGWIPRFGRVVLFHFE